MKLLSKIILFLTCLSIAPAAPSMEWAQNLPKVYKAVQNQERCGFCWGNFKLNEQISALNCNPNNPHLFHTACVEPWLEAHHICPACQRPAQIDRLLSNRELAISALTALSGCLILKHNELFRDAMVLASDYTIATTCGFLLPILGNKIIADIGRGNIARIPLSDLISFNQLLFTSMLITFTWAISHGLPHNDKFNFMHYAIPLGSLCGVLRLIAIVLMRAGL